MSIFIVFLNILYDQILIFLYIEVGSVISQEMAGVRGGYPTLFSYLIRRFFQGNSFEANEMKERKILWICYSSLCALYVSALCPVIVILQPNLQGNLTIAQGLYCKYFCSSAIVV